MEYFAEIPDQVDTPLRGLVIDADDTHVFRLSFVLKEQTQPQAAIEHPRPLHLQAAIQIAEFLTGRLQAFSLPTRATGTDFQKRVWAAIDGIPYGETRTYGEIGRNLGDVRLARAVGNAANRNPLPLIVPCHRVVGSNGDLTGFACGVATKAYLLALEQRAIAGLRGG